MQDLSFVYHGKSYGNKDLYTLNNYHNKPIYHLLIDEDSHVDTKLFEYIANKKGDNEKYNILDVLLQRSKFVNNEIESSVVANIDELLRIKILHQSNVDIAKTEDVELIKKALSINDAIDHDLYANVRKMALSQQTNVENSLKEIKTLFLSVLNDETAADKITNYLSGQKSVTEFNDLKKLSYSEYSAAFKSNTTLSEEDIEKSIKSILASLA